MDAPWMSTARCLAQLLLIWTSCVRGVIRCDCNTQECKDAGKTTCMGVKSCYTELYHNELSKGCDPAPLACENRKPAGLDLEWPAVYCCHDKDLCNKHALPPVATSDSHSKDESVSEKVERPKGTSNCSQSASPDGQQRSGPTSSGGTKIINPIYIAVPVAGVCVLLALIIFAMYLLRRRTDYHHHDSYHHYHHQLAPALTHKPSGSGGGAHHCHQCTCKKQTVPSCSKGNRCTDSERSSSGSETKLFLQT